MTNPVNPHTPLIGGSPLMQQVQHLIVQAARATMPVLISGETGTGKGLVASLIHASSDRKAGPFQKVLCHVIPKNLFESELFGHEPEAFTDARQLKKGLFELADGGTLFLDEVADIPLTVQTKLLQALEDFTFRRLGGTYEIRVDARLICATNKNLNLLVEAGQFRRDLFYRINVLSIELPPLRERREDIPLLVEYYLDFYEKCHNCPIKGICKEAISSLVEYPWPGNVRELQNVIQNCLIHAEGGIITPDYLPKEIVEVPPPPREAETLQSKIGDRRPMSNIIEVKLEEGVSLSEMLTQVERQVIIQALAQNRWNISWAAKALKIERRTLQRKLKAHQIEKKS